MQILLKKIYESNNFKKLYNNTSDCDLIIFEGHRSSGKSTLISLLTEMLNDNFIYTTNYSPLGSLGGRKSLGVNKTTGICNANEYGHDIGLTSIYALDFWLQSPEYLKDKYTVIMDRSTISSYIFGHANYDRLKIFRNMLYRFKKPVIINICSTNDDLTSRFGDDKIKLKSIHEEQNKFLDIILNYELNFPHILYTQEYFSEDLF